MVLMDANALGERGEMIASLALTSPHGDKPLFRPSRLGDKWPVADLVVELEGLPGRMFLLQVKTTQKNIGARKGRVPVDVDRERLQMLIGAPMPTYLVAVHEPTESAYVAVPTKKNRIRSLTTSFSLDQPSIRTRLYDEVKNFWARRVTPFIAAKSAFAD